jgi:glycosyltransferase involved in cell wall biosynthesis
LRGLADARSLRGHVLFCGQHADVRSFYWIADMFTLSSIAVETFSLAALEAMSTGLPCVLTRIGGAGEMIVEGGNGYLVEPGRPKLLADAWHRTLTGHLEWSPERIRHHVVLNFTLDACIKAYEEALVS